jgi:hypothetical protein
MNHPFFKILSFSFCHAMERVTTYSNKSIKQTAGQNPPLVGNSFEFSRRRENLTFSHHQEVQVSPPVFPSCFGK